MFSNCWESRLWCKRERAGVGDEMQRFVPIEDLFKGRHFDGQIIILCVAWYTSSKLSLPDLVSSAAAMQPCRNCGVRHSQLEHPFAINKHGGAYPSFRRLEFAPELLHSAWEKPSGSPWGVGAL
jgi:hypothetical protein